MKLYVDSPKWGGTTIYRQTSQFCGIVKDHHWSSFPSSDYDYIICSSVDEHPEWIREYPRSKKVFVMHENPLIWTPTYEDLHRFGIVIAPWEIIEGGHSNQLFIRAHSGVPWFYGINFDTNYGLIHKPLRSLKELDYLENLRLEPKRKKASCIVSGKGWLDGHKWRIEVAKSLELKFPGQVDIFGFGHRPLPDKALALDDYIYSVVIENTPSENYWTEKLADCILGGAIPIYSGAKYAQEDLGFEFPVIEFGEDPDDTAIKIIKILESCDANMREVYQCRQNVLHRHNFMYWVPNLLESHIG